MSGNHISTGAESFHNYNMNTNFLALFFVFILDTILVVVLGAAVVLLLILCEEKREAFHLSFKSCLVNRLLTFTIYNFGDECVSACWTTSIPILQMQIDS